MSTRNRATFPLLVVIALGCGAACVAPVRWSGPAARPDRHLYKGAHGRPLAYGGDVCAIEERHTHSFHPVPAAAFDIDDGGNAHETRALYPYFDPHPHHGRTCFRSGWHLHLEPPVEELVYSDKRAAYAKPSDSAIDAALDQPLDVYRGRHAPLSCEERPCTFAGRHGHRRCPGAHGRAPAR